MTYVAVVFSICVQGLTIGRILLSGAKRIPNEVLQAWRREYNEERTHSAIGDVTPREFIVNHQHGVYLTQQLTSSALV